MTRKTSRPMTSRWSDAGAANSTAEKMLKRRLLGRAGRPNLPTVMIEAYNVMQDRITRARLAGDPPTS